jgi:CubicO group peptidase (beta-lactamase class C family)
MYRIVSFVVAALLLVTPAFAQDKAGEIDKLFGWAKPDAPGCAVAVSQRGKLVADRAYGSADLERGAPLTPGSVFDIASVRKQFVAAAVLLLAEDGKLSLTDDIRKHIPELPDYGHKVTVDHLLTHTSGIREWTGLMQLSGENADILPLILRQRGLNFTPGEEWGYSNSGYVLATELVARASGMPVADFMRRRLFEPLGMKSTAYSEDLRDVIKNRALAYEKEGNNWKLEILLGKERGRGSGAVLSTAGDIVIWNDALAGGRLGAFVTKKLYQEPATLNNGRKLNYGRGLHVHHYPGVTLVSHSGGGGGYSVWSGFSPNHGLSVALLCNTDAMGTTQLAHRVADLFLPPPTAPDPGPVAIQGVDVTGRAGLYFAERTGEPLRLTVNRGRLSIGGGPVLVPVSADRFRPQRADLYFRSQDEFELTFRSNDEIELKSMEGQVTRYRRAQPYAPTADDLKAFTGRYESDEVGSVFQMVPGKDGLVMRLELSPDHALPLNPAARDTFQQPPITVRFQRDNAGKVVSFDYNHPLARNMRFTRLGERAVSAAAPAQLPAPPPAASAAPASPAPRAEGLTGEYEIAPGRTLAITLEGGQLHGQPAGGEKHTLVHVSGATFSVANTPITLTFTLGADGRATAVEMRQNGRERTLPKVR